MLARTFKSVTRLRNLVVRSARHFEPYSSFQILSVVVLYGLAIVTFLYAVITEPALQRPVVRLSTVLGALVLPFVAVSVAFSIQILGLFVDARKNLQEARAQSRFLSALDASRGKSISSRLFLSHLLDEWDRNLTDLHQGKITVLKEYWKVSAALYHQLAKRCIECTSVLPLDYWDGSGGDNAELMAYLDEQKTKLVKRDITVRRTFILRASEIADAERFFKVAYNQHKEGFEIFYVPIDDISDDEVKARLNIDFALIDESILMVGRLASTNRAVYYYDFYDLDAARFAGMAKSALPMMQNAAAFADRLEPPNLLITRYRHRVTDHPRLAEPQFSHWAKAFSV